MQILYTYEGEYTIWGIYGIASTALHHVPLYTQDNYKDIFEAVLVFLDSFDTYSNFL